MSLKPTWLNSQQTIDMVLLTSTTTFCTGSVIFLKRRVYGQISWGTILTKNYVVFSWSKALSWPWYLLKLHVFFLLLIFKHTSFKCVRARSIARTRILMPVRAFHCKFTTIARLIVHVSKRTFIWWSILWAKVQNFIQIWVSFEEIFHFL